MSTPQRPNYTVEIGPNGPRVVNAAAPTPKNPGAWVQYLRLMRFDRPIGILLLLWPTLAALWLAAGGMPSARLITIFALGVVLTRAAGCVINDYADRWLDGQVERTRERPLATGAISGKAALALFGLLMLAAFALVSLTNRPTIYLSLAALLVAVAYPYAKRHTYYAQVVLGVAFSMGIPMAFTAHDQVPASTAVLLWIGNLAWTIAYDTLYAMVDRPDDLKAGAKSTAILFGELDLVMVGILQTFAVFSWGLLGQRHGLAWPYFFGLVLIVFGFAWQIRLARTRTRANYFSAFLANQWIGALLFLSIVFALYLQAPPSAPGAENAGQSVHAPNDAFSNFKESKP